jgi:beta-lactamase regulating signal transducer with metallopeptidase domain
VKVWTWAEIGVLNALSATALALVAALVTWRFRSPTLAHAVWALVLLKLVSVPILELNVEPLLAPLRAVAPGKPTAPLQRTSAIPHETADWMSTRAHGLDAAAPEWVADRTGATHGRTQVQRGGLHAGNAVRALIPAAAWAGAVALIVLWIVRATRFRRRLRFTSRSSPSLDVRVRLLSESLGVSRPPRVRLIHERIPPSLLPSPGGCEILIPETLLARLTDAELETLLAHELAHFRRRDHWMRTLELAVGALFWWHPVAWWARRNLRVAEEQCCDVLVKRALPHRARAYAESLLKTVEFLSTQNVSVPALATGAGESSRIKERIKMILNRNAPRPLPIRLRLLLSALAVVAIGVSPAWVDRDAGVEAAEPENQPDVVRGVAAAVIADQREAERTATERERDMQLEAAEHRMLELRRERLRLEREFAELEFERMKVHARLEAAEAKVQEQRLREELRSLEAEGQHESANMLRQRLEIIKQESALRQQKFEFEQQHMRRRMDVEFELRQLEIELHKAEAENDHERLDELQLRMQELRGQLQEFELEAMRGELLQSRQRLELERAKLQNRDTVR